jgi:hypothetical protein
MLGKEPLSVFRNVSHALYITGSRREPEFLFAHERVSPTYFSFDVGGHRLPLQENARNEISRGKRNVPKWKFGNEGKEQAFGQLLLDSNCRHHPGADPSTNSATAFLFGHRVFLQRGFEMTEEKAPPLGTTAATSETDRIGAPSSVVASGVSFGGRVGGWRGVRRRGRRGRFPSGS